MMKFGLLSWILCFQIAFGQAIPALAAESMGKSLSLSQELSNAAPGSEFVSGNFPGAVLMPVNLWGAIAKPGIHHIPLHTDLVTLISLAGGPIGDAKMDKILIKRRNGQEEQVLKIDADEILSEPGKRSPTLEANDIIIVPRDKPTISPDTSATMGFIAGMISLVLAGIALNNQLSK